MDIGRVIDERYQIEAFLGQGAVGSVYRARDVVESRVVAVKVWNADQLTEQIRGRFAREAAALSQLRHPNIVFVYGHGMVDGLPYVAMELLEGETLEARLGEGEPLETKLAFDVAKQMLGALAFAHGLGVVHRDLKPDNVFLAKRPGGHSTVVKLLDYGLAKFLSPGADPMQGKALTMTGMVMGTPLYMPPEQAAGGDVDLRVDVYSAGCVIFEVLTGQPPYLGNNHGEILRAHLVSPVPKVSEFRSEDEEVLPALQTFLETALAKKAAGRFENAAVMLEALNAIPQPAIRPRQGALPAPPAARVAPPAPATKPAAAKPAAAKPPAAPAATSSSAARPAPPAQGPAAPARASTANAPAAAPKRSAPVAPPQVDTRLPMIALGVVAVVILGGLLVALLR